MNVSEFEKKKASMLNCFNYIHWTDLDYLKLSYLYTLNWSRLS
jgi:hypothetical protein